ncbi:Probable E3 ubiquitin-protein ligase ARI7 [Linum perenne]
MCKNSDDDNFAEFSHISSDCDDFYGEESDYIAESDSGSSAADLLEELEAPPPPPELPYTAMNESDIRRRMNEDVNQLSALLCLSASDASLILRQFGWSAGLVQESWFADEFEARRRVGLPTTEIKQVIHQSDQFRNCTICFELKPLSSFASAACGHLFCRGCWRQYIAKIVNEGARCLKLRCPEPWCGVAAGDDLIGEIADSKDRERYFNFVLRSYIEENRGRKWCPAPNCECAVEFCMSGDANYDVSCLCSHSFCWNCCEDRHRPVDCETVKNWAVKNDSESENENWKKVNTKPCPKCGRAIEKNEGCMHMTCASPCHHHFCWVCLGPWQNHKSCNRYDEDNALTSLRLELNRYQHYYDRWAANENSRQIAMKDLENVRENVVSAISKIHGQGVGQVLFLMEAWEQIVECRRVLKWTYAYGFYLGSEEAEKKNFFEYLQGQAESCLDKLHDCAEKEMKKFAMEGSCIHEYVSFRMKLHELTKLCKTYFENLVGALENGLSDVQTSKRKHADSCELILYSKIKPVELTDFLFTMSNSDSQTEEYEVFLSFRGFDVHQSFADHLYACLVRSKIRTFRDDEVLQKGETIGR